MITKACIYCYFGRPMGWEEKFIANFNTLEKFGWHWIIFTDVDVKSKGNVQVIPMNIEQYKDLILAKFGVRPNYYITHKGIPNAPLTYSPAFGYMFEDYLKGYDFWGWTGLDVVMGRVDRYITDEFLDDCDVFGNDPDAINGCLSLFRNSERINKLFMEHPDWKKILRDEGCYAFDEVQFSETVRDFGKRGKIRFKSAFWIEGEHNPAHSHIKNGVTLKMLEDGTLMNTFTNKEIMMFHFNYTKKYPQL